MNKKVLAFYANCVFTPLEPLDLEEGTEVVLNIETATSPDSQQKTVRRKFRVIPNHSEFLPGMDDPKKMKQILNDEDEEHYLKVTGLTREQREIADE